MPQTFSPPDSDPLRQIISSDVCHIIRKATTKGYASIDCDYLRNPISEQIFPASPLLECRGSFATRYLTISEEMTLYIHKRYWEERADRRFIVVPAPAPSAAEFSLTSLLEATIYRVLACQRECFRRVDERDHYECSRRDRRVYP
jgi:hypothetical protein